MADSGQWMPIYWADYFADTTHLSTEEHGAYLLMIGAYWRRGQALPGDRSFLASVVKMTVRRFKAVEIKLSDMFVIVDGLWYHVRVEIELLKSCVRITSARASANARWHASDMLPTTTTTEESKKNLLNRFVVGKKNGAGNGGITILDPNERLNRFQKTLAESFREKGWEIVTAAADPQHPNFSVALETCKTQARLIGKGWPKQWPIAT